MQGQDAEPFYLGYIFDFSAICYVYIAKYGVGE